MMYNGLGSTIVSEQHGRSLKIDLSTWIFWITFILSFLATRPLIVITNGRYRIGLVVFMLGLILVLSQLRLINRQLLLSIALLGIVAVISGVINHSSLVQIIAFSRIPLTAYLVYYLVAVYLTDENRVQRVFRIMYWIALVQLPILILQRISYPYLPSQLKFSVLQGQLSTVDFAMGTFDGDAHMTFFLIALLILLLFYDQIGNIVKHKWFMAIWLTLTIFVGNSQIQQLVTVIVWFIYLLSHLKLKNLIIIGLGIALLVGAMNYLNQTGVLTFAPFKHTMVRATRLFSETGRQERIDKFLAGQQARDGAIYYYLEQDIKWIGDGPGRYYDTATRERTLGSWGHLFTFYAEVGVIGLLISLLVFFVIAFPLSITGSKVTLSISWVQVTMFISILILSLARYPMNTIPIIFTYCVTLIGYKIVAQPKQLRLH